MKALLNPTIILLLFVLVSCGDVALVSVSFGRKIVYGGLALLALIYLIATLIL